MDGANLTENAAKITNLRNIKKEFLVYLFKSNIIQKQIQSHIGQVSQPKLALFRIKKLRFPCPAINEQQEIAFILSKVDELIRFTEKIVERTQSLKKGLMQRLLTKGIGHSKFKKTEIGEIPIHWKLEKLGNLLSLCQYGLSLSLSANGKYPIFRMNNIENGYMITNDMKYIDLDKKTFEQFKLEKNDILINRTNSIELVGKLGIFILDGNYTFASYLIRMRTKKEKLLPFFLNLFLNTKKMQYKLKSLATPGVSQANINANNLKSLNIPVPNLNEQERIISILLEIDSKLPHYQFELKNLSELKKGLMQQLLTGRIRVKV